jgi:group I intron endonuclease
MPILRAISKYGADNFKFRVIEECNDDKVNERETYWIQKLEENGKNGYNITLGGEGIKKPKKYWSNHPHSKAVSCYTLEGEWVKDYESIGLAVDDVSEKKKGGPIRACIKGTTFQAFGYRWSWKGEELKLVEKRVNIRGIVYGINPTLGQKKMWKSMADAAEEITGNRKNNNGLYHSLKSSDNNKLQVNGWYFFRTKPTKWKAAEHKGFTPESAKRAGKISAEKTKKPVYGVSIITGEVIEFDSILAASYFIKGNGNKGGVANIWNNIQNIKNGQTWCYAFGYKWYDKQ